MKLPMSHPDPRFNVFFYLTGFTFAAFASGFGVCLFNLETVDACVELADGWVDIFQAMGDHIVEWFFSILEILFPDYIHHS